MCLRPNTRALRILHQVTQQVHQPHLLHRRAPHLQQLRRPHHDRQRLRPRHRHVEPVGAQQERRPARRLVERGGAERDDHDRRLLPLELVHRADPDPRTEPPAQAAHLQVERRDDQDVPRASSAARRRRRPPRRRPSSSSTIADDRVALLVARLGAAVVRHRHPDDAGLRGHRARCRGSGAPGAARSPGCCRAGRRRSRPR